MLSLTYLTCLPRDPFYNLLGAQRCGERSQPFLAVFASSTRHASRFPFSLDSFFPFSLLLFLPSLPSLTFFHLLFFSTRLICCSFPLPPSPFPHPVTVPRLGSCQNRPSLNHHPVRAFLSAWLAPLTCLRRRWPPFYSSEFLPAPAQRPRHIAVCKSRNPPRLIPCREPICQHNTDHIAGAAPTQYKAQSKRELRPQEPTTNSSGTKHKVSDSRSLCSYEDLYGAASLFLSLTGSLFPSLHDLRLLPFPAPTAPIPRSRLLSLEQ